MSDTWFGFAAPFDEHDSIAEVRREAEALAKSDLPILVVGEPGTGRTTMAKAVAAARARRRESAVRDLSLGAERDAWGDNDVLLIRLVDAAPRPVQVRLADAIRTEQRLVVLTASVDGEKTLDPELRAVVASTTLVLPPLRRRGIDAVAWAHFFLQRLAPNRGLDEATRHAIGAAPWPGNLVELKSCVERAAAITDHEMLSVTDLGLDEGPPPIVPLSDAVDDFKRRYVLEVVERLGGNRTRAAKALGVDPRTVFRVLEDNRRDES